MILSKSSDASPEILGKALSCLINLKKNKASYLITDVMKQYVNTSIIQASYQLPPCDERTKSALSLKISKAGDFLSVLGFYQLSSQLFRAVYILEPNNLSIIKKLAKTYLLSDEETKLSEFKKEIESPSLMARKLLKNK